jgi:exopolysaccharide biosynthesis polyprenyl glycosylphosphotransferase
MGSEASASSSEASASGSEPVVADGSVAVGSQRRLAIPIRGRRLRFRGPTSPRLRDSEGAITEAPLGSSIRRETFVRRALGIADIVAAILAILLGVSVLGADSLNPPGLLAVPLILLVSKVSGLYDRDEHLLHKSTIDEIPTLFSVATLSGFMIYLAGDLIVDGEMGRDQAAGLWALLLMLMFSTRSLARLVALRATRSERCLVLGDDTSSSWVSRKLLRGQGVNAHVVATFPLAPGPLANRDGGRAPGRLASIIRDKGIDRVIIAPDGGFSEDILDVIRLVKGLGVRVSVLPRLFEVVGSSVEVDEVDGLTLLGVRRYGLTSSSRLVKRTLDLSIAGLGFILIAPLFLSIAIAIKLDSRGPVFFRQRRMGQNDVPFDMLKFRTMIEGADEQKAALRDRNEAGEGLFKVEDDPRITRVGRLLRRTSLDELPQLLNVLRGEMSLVGPRPLVIDEDVQIAGWRRDRLQLPPGMTGLWQVFGSARIPMDEMVKIDYRYGANWSLWLDVKILMQTVPFVLGRRGL